MKIQKYFGESLSGESVNRKNSFPYSLIYPFTHSPSRTDLSGKPIHPFTIILIFAFLLVGCGYTLQGRETLPFDSVRIGKIENRTFEPKLEDKLKKTLSDELMKTGVMISNDSRHVINGVIETFELKALSEKEGLTSEYEVIIKGKFFLTLPDGKIQELRGSGSFIVSFYNTGNLQSIMASKEQTIETALKNLSSEIRAGMIYR